jgi:hypothetical protein
MRRIHSNFVVKGDYRQQRTEHAQYRIEKCRIWICETSDNNPRFWAHPGSKKNFRNGGGWDLRFLVIVLAGSIGSDQLDCGCGMLAEIGELK